MVLPVSVGLSAYGPERRKQLLFGSLLGEQDLDKAFEFDEGRTPWLAKPALQCAAPLHRDCIDGSRPPAHKLALGRGKPVLDQLPRLLVDVTFSPRPVARDASPHLLRELICRPAPQREQA